MNTRYQNEHYEDVTRILSTSTRHLCPLFQQGSIFHKDRFDRCDVVAAFANLFAADNPSTCLHCGQIAELGDTCPVEDEFRAHHAHTQGFDRERFLAACGLKSK